MEKMITRKSGRVTESIPLSWLAEEEYKRKKASIIKNKALTAARKRAKEEVEREQQPKIGIVGKIGKSFQETKIKKNPFAKFRASNILFGR